MKFLKSFLLSQGFAWLKWKESLCGWCVASRPWEHVQPGARKMRERLQGDARNPNLNKGNPESVPLKKAERKHYILMKVEWRHGAQFGANWVLIYSNAIWKANCNQTKCVFRLASIFAYFDWSCLYLLASKLISISCYVPCQKETDHFLARYHSSNLIRSAI